LGRDSEDSCGVLVREWRVGGNEVSSRACVEDSRGFWRGRSIIYFFELVLVNLAWY